MIYEENSIKHKTWAEIDLSALKNNYSSIKATVGSSEVMCVVKADAYGHGAESCASALYETGARWFAVSCIEEALQLSCAFATQNRSDAKILILGYTPPENIELLSQNDIRQTVFSSEYASALSNAAVKSGCEIKAHFKLDTGMNRLGFDADADAADEICIASTLPGIVPEGLFTHFACADEDDDTETRAAFDRFARVDSVLRSRGLKLWRHVCNSAATLKFPEYHLDMVRAGIILYGLMPYPDTPDIGLRPVMTFKSIVSHIHTVKKGKRVSYNGIYTADHDVLTATVPVGYADGFLRHFSGGVYINGQTAPILGRICMDQCIVDISAIPDVKVGDEVIIFGGDPSRLDTLASSAGTINYELVCLVGKRVARIYTN